MVSRDRHQSRRLRAIDALSDIVSGSLQIPAVAAVVAEEFKAALGRPEIDVVFVADGTGQILHADVPLLIGELGNDAGDERPDGGFRHEHGRGQSAGVVFEAGFSHFVEGILDSQTVLDCPAIGKKGCVDEFVGEFLPECESVFLSLGDVVHEVGVHEHLLGRGVDEGVGFPASGEFVEGDQLDVKPLLHEALDVHAPAGCTLGRFGQRIGGDTLQLPECEFSNA